KAAPKKQSVLRSGSSIHATALYVPPAGFAAAHRQAVRSASSPELPPTTPWLLPRKLWVNPGDDGMILNGSVVTPARERVFNRVRPVRCRAGSCTHDPAKNAITHKGSIVCRNSKRRHERLLGLNIGSTR